MAEHKIPKTHRLVQSKITALDEQGLQIFYRCYLPLRADKIEFSLYLCHGAAEYHRRYEEVIAAFLLQYGEKIQIFISDFRGHGLSTGARAYVKNFNDYVSDFVLFFQTMEQNYGIYPSYLLCHSMGGAVALKSLKLHPKVFLQLQGCILSNPCLKVKPSAAVSSVSPWLASLRENLPPAIGKVRLPTLFYGKNLTYDQKKAHEFDEDVLIPKFITLGMSFSLLRQWKFFKEQVFFYKTPMLFLLSDEDQLVEVEATQLFIKGLDQLKTKFILYQRARHELLQETGRSQVLKDIFEWIDQQESHKISL